MRIALLTRPQWEGSTASTADPRIVLAPLQQLCRLSSQADEAAAFAQATPEKFWIIFTSPASVQAFSGWLDDAKQQVDLGARISRLILAARLAAVGLGTQDYLRPLVDQGIFSSQQIDTIVTVQSRDNADAAGLLSALSDCAEQQGWLWQGQRLWLVQGQDNRPTLALGLAKMGAAVHPLVLYSRRSITFSATVKDLIRVHAKTAGDLGIVITSSAVVQPAVDQICDLAVDPQAIVWCTQHQSIAARLRDKGIQRVRRIRLEPAQLTRDLFIDEKDW